MCLPAGGIPGRMCVMPGLFWVPLDILPPVKERHLQAAITRWFDASEDTDDGRRVGHWAGTKPYTVSPLGEHLGEFGVWISALTRDAADLLVERCWQEPVVRLGGEEAAVGTPSLETAASWAELARQPPVREWRVEFQSPTTFRTQGAPNLLPQATTLLRAPRVAWEEYSDVPLDYAPAKVAAAVRVTELNLRTVSLPGTHSRVPALVGTVGYACDCPDVARQVAPLLALAPFSGVGSNKSAGMGAVRIQFSARRTRSGRGH